MRGRRDALHTATFHRQFLPGSLLWMHLRLVHQTLGLLDDALRKSHSHDRL